MSDTMPSAATLSQSSSPNHPGLARQDSRGSASGAVDSRFSCNICLDAVVEPVVTQCGHLYCWPCLYRWLEPGMYPNERASLGLMAATTVNSTFAPMVNTSRRVCPVCKSACSLASLVPIYVRSTNDASPARESPQHEGTGNSSNSDPAREPQDAEVTAESRHDNDEQGNSDSQSSSHHDGDVDGGGVEESTGIASTTGLRQRLRFRSRDSEILDEGQEEGLAAVPNRPAATSPPQPSSPSLTTSNSSNHEQQYTHRNNNWITPLSPSGHGGSLTHGILLSFQQATYSAGNDMTSSTDGSIPSLHFSRSRDANGNLMSHSPHYGEQQQGSHIDVDSETTQYLSRLLIMLTSFVVLCLLLL